MAETEPAEDDVAEYWQTHIYAPDKEYTTYASVEADSPELEHAATRRGSKRELILTEGGDVVNDMELDPDFPFLSQQDDEHNLNRTVVYDAGVAVGYYAHHLETHGVPEDEVWDQFEMLADEHGLPLDQYLDFYGTLDERQRRLRLLDLLEFRVEDAGDWAAEPYLRGENAGTWRSTDLSESGEKFARSVARTIDLNPKHCYRNAQQAAIKHKDNHRVKYVDGIALPKNGAQVSRHAWVEYDGEVVELTWPWHFFDGKEAVYFGTEFDKEEVAEVFERRNGGSQIALSDEQTAKMNAIRGGEDV
jgi:hypothetical protein